MGGSYLRTELERVKVSSNHYGNGLHYEDSPALTEPVNEYAEQCPCCMAPKGVLCGDYGGWGHAKYWEVFRFPCRDRINRWAAKRRQQLIERLYGN